MEKRFNIPLIDHENYRPSYYYHAYELPRVPVISSANPGEIDLYQWGLIPSWTRNEEYANDIRYKTFNARSETITEKPSFKNPFKFFSSQRDGWKIEDRYIFPGPIQYFGKKELTDIFTLTLILEQKTSAQSRLL